MEELHVLIIEDEKKIADSIARGLKELQYEVTTAYDGSLGLRLFENGNFNMSLLILIFRGLTDMNYVSEFVNAINWYQS
jgi:two-component system, OmpR family, copper resistance phosphate regulon response regulator CusR